MALNESVHGPVVNTDAPGEDTESTARAAARDFLERVPPPEAPTVTYRSAGRVVLWGDGSVAIQAAQELGRRGLACTVIIEGGVVPVREGRGPEYGFTVVQGRMVSVQGHLGAFRVALQDGENTVDLAEYLGLSGFDIVVDMGATPYLDWPVLPLGYHACGPDPTRLAQALDQAARLVGDFSKPRFFAYDPQICAHGAAGVNGCTRCLDSCPTRAILSVKDRIQVDPYLCQGEGICSTVCPTGAIRYAYPAFDSLLANLREALARYRQAGGIQPALMFHDLDDHALEQALSGVPEYVVPVALKRMAAAGIELWLLALAHGVRQVLLIGRAGMPRDVFRALNAQVVLAQAFLGSLGYDPARVLSLTFRGEQGLERRVSRIPPLDPTADRELPVVEGKREAMGRALEALYDRAPAHPAVSELPEGAPYGEVRIDPDGCILCMACVHVCPGRALRGEAGTPRLFFVEDDCVQCGLCAGNCPEGAVTLAPRFVWSRQTRKSARLLHEERPFHCIRCGTPFTTASMLQRMTERLEGNWVFAQSASARRLQMCPRCRMLDVSAEGMPGPPGAETGEV
ncbi:MAG: 4Fe-4S binding protein [Gammaproteobacteria bacterium]|nr:4Fe-4S binding protein [Gammaproteobacteria bacterium]